MNYFPATKKKKNVTKQRYSGNTHAELRFHLTLMYISFICQRSTFKPMNGLDKNSNFHTCVSKSIF